MPCIPRTVFETNVLRCYTRAVVVIVLVPEAALPSRTLDVVFLAQFRLRCVDRSNEGQTARNMRN